MSHRPPISAPLAPDRFLQTILKSGLLDRVALEGALAWIPRDRWDDPAALANYLVQMGRLSRFQARKLLQGKSLGLVLGPYHVLAPIGKGGMSRVYLARDYRGLMLVALKILPPKKARQDARYLVR